MELVSKLLIELSSQILHIFPSHITDVRVTNSLSLSLSLQRTTNHPNMINNTILRSVITPT